jgi:predicted nucleic acid-binding protein
LVQFSYRTGSAAGKVIEDLEAGKFRGVASELTLLELTVRPLQLARQDVADEYELLLDHFPNLELAPVTREILLLAAGLGARHRLRTPDAIQVFTITRLELRSRKHWPGKPGNPASSDQRIDFDAQRHLSRAKTRSAHTGAWQIWNRERVRSIGLRNARRVALAANASRIGRTSQGRSRFAYRGSLRLRRRS